MMLGVIPKIERFLRDSGNVLPPLTQALLDMSQWLTQHLPGIGIGLGVVLVAMFTISRWPPGRLWLHKIWLRMPVVGGISRLAETSVFARGMSILLESGVTLIDGLQTVEGLVRNRAVARRVAESRVAVARGETLAHALGAGSEFLPMLPRMVTVGESTGLLGRTLGDVAKFHESQLVATIRKLGLVIEPVMIIVVGGIVGFVYVAFFMALFSMASGAG
jgi:type IV pilus assembly protein PilC